MSIVTDRRFRLVFVLAFLASVVGYVYVLPYDWTNSSPLTWDQAGHYFQAWQFAEAARGADATGLLGVLRSSDQYPPGHSIALGTWFLAFGHDMAGWATFGLVVFVSTALLLARAGAVAVVALIISPMLLGLAPTLMVEPLACLWLAVAFASYPESSGGGYGSSPSARPSRRRSSPSTTSVFRWCPPPCSQPWRRP